MNEWPQLLVVVLAEALCICIGRFTGRERARLGLQSGVMVGADDSSMPSPTLFSARLGLVARPDHVLRVGPYIIPIEQKPLARRALACHVMQVATECILIEGIYEHCWG